MKKTIVGILIFLLLVILGLAAYYFLFRPEQLADIFSPPDDSGPATSSSTPTSPLVQLTADPVVAYLPQNGFILAVGTDGRVFEARSDKNKILNQNVLPNLQSASFSKDGSYILAKFGSRQEPLWSIFNLASSSWTTVENIKITDAVWSPEKNEIAYIEKTNSGYTLGILDARGNTDPKTKTASFTRRTLERFSLPDMRLLWISPNEIIVQNIPSKFAASTVLKYKIKEKMFSVLAQTTSAHTTWSKDGSRGLLFAFDTTYKLTAVDNAGIPIRELNIIALPEKCAFGDQLLYCLGPQDENARRALLPDDYYKKTLPITDLLYEIDVESGSIRALLTGAEPIEDGTRPAIFNNELFFIESGYGQNRLVKFSLPKK